MDFKIIGQGVPRVDGLDKVTGRAKYASDITVVGMIKGKFLRSPYAHARILSIKTTEAENSPGVFAVLTARDVEGINPFLDGEKRKDHPIIAIERAVFAGQPVAAVAAVDEESCEEALGKIEVEYEELPAVFTVQEAMADGAPQIHPFAPRNICFQDKLEKGDIQKGFLEADEILEDTFEFPMVYHYSMEPHVTVAKWDEDGITVWSSTAHPFGVRQDIANVFRLPLSKIRVIVPFVGGAYGSKSGTKIEALVVALAKKAGRPVKVSQNVGEAMLTCRRHSAICRVKTGAKKDGTLVAKEAEIYLNTGAFAELGPTVTGRTLTRILGPYRVPHIKVQAYCIYTNTISAASFRSIGGPQTAWATESQMDIIADKLGIDPAEMRKKNLLKKGEELKPRGNPLDADLFGGLEKVLQKMGWSGPKTSQGGGRGVAFGVTDPGAPLASTATVHVLSDNSVIILAGTTEIGQGSRTVMSQIAAEELSVPLESVVMRPTDTAYTPFDRSTGSSRSTTVMGKAVQLAAREARKQLVELAADYFEAPPEAIVLREGEASAAEKKISYGDLIRRHFVMQGGELIGCGYAHGGMAPKPSNPLFWEVGIGAVELEVDAELGTLRMIKYITAADVGKALNPIQCEGQDEGAAMMGFGHTLFESIIYENGQILNPSLIDYRVPSFSEVPEEFECILVEDGNGPGPYGAKGMGEGSIIPVAPAVANALFWATGARIKKLPLTPEEVWKGVRAEKSRKSGKGSD